MSSPGAAIGIQVGICRAHQAAVSTREDPRLAEGRGDQTTEESICPVCPLVSFPFFWSQHPLISTHEVWDDAALHSEAVTQLRTIQSVSHPQLQ